MKTFFGMLLILFLVACGQESTAVTVQYTPVEAPELIPEVYIEPTDIPLQNEYIVALEVDPSARIIHGISRINFTNRTSQPLNEIVLRIFLNAFCEDVSPRPYARELISRMQRPGDSRGYMTISYASANNDTLDFMLDNTVLTLYMPEALEVDATVQLVVQFDAYVPRLAHYMGGNDYAMWLGMFLPVVAVFGDNGWNKDAFYPIGAPFMLESANYNVSITTPVHYEVVGTGNRIEEIIDIDTEIKITRFSANSVRDFAFAILSPYYNRISTSTASGVEINLFHRTEGFAESVLSIVRGSVGYFEYRVGAYPFGQINIVETDMLVESVAFSQIIFADTMQLSRSRFIELSQSIAHQWLTGVVGINPVAEPWLGTGLTRFMVAGMLGFTTEEFHNYMRTNHANISHRNDLYMYQGIDENTTMWNAYMPTHGVKAMLMIYQLQQRMGYALFWEFIGRYYSEFSFQIASGEQFMQLAEEVYGHSLQEFFYMWIFEGTVPELWIG